MRINEIATEMLNFTIKLSQKAKEQGLRKHHITIGHMGVIFAIQSIRPEEGGLTTEYTLRDIYMAHLQLGSEDKLVSVKRYLDELVRLGFLEEHYGKYSYALKTITH